MHYAFSKPQGIVRACKENRCILIMAPSSKRRAIPQPSVLEAIRGIVAGTSVLVAGLACRQSASMSANMADAISSCCVTARRIASKLPPPTSGQDLAFCLTTWTAWPLDPWDSLASFRIKPTAGASSESESAGRACSNERARQRRRSLIFDAQHF